MRVEVPAMTLGLSFASLQEATKRGLVQPLPGVGSGQFGYTGSTYEVFVVAVVLGLMYYYGASKLPKKEQKKIDDSDDEAMCGNVVRLLGMLSSVPQ